MLQKKIIIDTDIGDDIDDLIALEYLAKRPDVELIGITTVWMNSFLRARMVKKVLSLLGKPDIPVYAGYGTPLGSFHHIHLDEIFCQAVDDLNKEKYSPLNQPGHEEEAIDFIVNAARKYGDQLTILGIGPLTNIAKAIEKDEEAMKRVHLHIMGGCFFRPFVEWNIECDYLAAEKVFAKALDLVAVGVDVTEKTTFNKNSQDVFHLDHTPYGQYRNRCIELWQKANPTRIMTLHDPLAAMSIVEPSILEFFPRHIHVCVDQSGFTTGLTLPIEDLRGPLYVDRMSNGYPLCRVAFKVDVDAFQTQIRQMIGKGAKQ